MNLRRSLSRREGPAALAVVLAVGLAVGLAAASMAAGCTRTARRASPDFPPPLTRQQDEVVDIQVVRRGTSIRLSNTTARSFPAGRMWVNQRFSRRVPPLPAGESLELNLKEFRDRDGEPFRAGGFFATRDPVPVVLCQLELPPGAGDAAVGAFDGTAGRADRPAGPLIGFVVVANELE